MLADVLFDRVAGGTVAALSGCWLIFGWLRARRSVR